MDWTPLFTGTEAESIRNKIIEIAHFVSGGPSADPYLMHGDAGRALFLFDCYRMTEDERYFKSASRLLLSCIKQIQSELLYIDNPQTCRAGFENGLSGIGWTIDYLLTHEMLENDLVETMGAADSWLLRRMIYDLKSNKLDLMQGAVGIALYGLKRKERFVKEYMKRFTEDLLAQISQVELYAVRDFSIPTGLSGLFLLLVKLQGIYPEFSDLEVITSRIGDIFKLQAEAGQTEESSVMGWCGHIEGTLWAMSHIPTARDYAIRQWLRLGERHAVQRKTVWNAGLYGGNFSMGHLFIRLCHFYRDDRFREFSRMFFRNALQKADYFEKKTGHTFWLTGINETYALHRGLLGGLSGIGLTLMASIWDREPSWDEALLLS